jgi:hypothetical protein
VRFLADTIVLGVGGDPETPVRIKGIPENAKIGLPHFVVQGSTRIDETPGRSRLDCLLVPHLDAVTGPTE